MKELPKVYDPKQVESKIYDMWMRGGYFAGLARAQFMVQEEQKPQIPISG